MGISPVNQYRFTCDEMRYTDEQRHLVELCDGTEVFSGADEYEAGKAAEAAGWYYSNATTTVQGVVCPFHMHGLINGSDWPPEIVQLRSELG